MAGGTASRAYLLAYNAMQAIGWSVCLYQMVVAAAGGADVAGIYRAGAPAAGWMQSIALLETVHAAAGMVRSSTVQAFLQWLGRSNALFRVAQAIPELHASPAAPLMLACWSVGEMVRYPWYVATGAGACPAWLTWLRYTAFIPIYPTGMVAEMALMHLALPYIRERHIFSLAMPNRLNFAFDYATFTTVFLLAYPYLWWGLYSTLLRQRRKKLGPGAAAAAEAGAASGKEE